MVIFEEIDKKLEEIYLSFKKDKEDLTGWSLIQLLKKESNGNNLLFHYFIYRIFEISLKKSDIINISNLIKELIESPFKEDEITVFVGDNKTDFKEIYKGVYLKQGILIKILTALDLKKTKNLLVNILILKNEEINPKIYLGEKMIEDYKKDPLNLNINLIKCFEKEYKENKLSKKDRIIKYS